MIQPVDNYANVLGFHWLSVIERNNPRGSLSVSKNWLDFHLAFNIKKVYMRKKCINNVYIKFNCALKNVKISFYFSHSMEFSIIKHNLQVFYSKKYNK
jgi:hypothetical protein